MSESTVRSNIIDSQKANNSGICFVMKWQKCHDIEFCKEVVVSRLFETRKKSAERGKVWEAIAKKLEKLEYPKFKVDQRSVRDRLKKLLKQFRKQDRIERASSGISPEQTELEALLEEISAREEAAETIAADVEAKEKVQVVEDRLAAEEMRKQAMEKLSETRKRKEDDEGGVKPKVRKGGNPALAFLAEKAEKEQVFKEESMRLERERMVMERERMEKSAEQQNKMWTAVLEMQNQNQATQMLMMQQQQQQGQALLALLAKVSAKEN